MTSSYRIGQPSIRKLSSRVPAGNRWNTQIQITQEEFIYKVTFSKRVGSFREPHERVPLTVIVIWERW